jgi:hypothetical protein
MDERPQALFAWMAGNGVRSWQRLNVHSREPAEPG